MKGTNQTKVRVKLCGSCNPIVDTKAILEELQERKTDFEFVPFSTLGKMILILSGCSVNCAAQSQFNGSVVEVAGNSLDGWIIPQERLIDEILKSLEAMRQGGNINA